MISLEEAQQKILAVIQPLPSEDILLDDSGGRYLAETIVSPLDLPPADNSAMDGYALLASSVSSIPCKLQLIGEQAAGSPVETEITPGTCMRIFTGAVLPRGADAIVMQEDTQPDPKDRSKIRILDKVAPWENIRFRGEDVKAGSVLVEADQFLNAPRLALLSSAGIYSVKVFRRPVVGLLATGDELRQSPGPLAPGQIYESNRIALHVLTCQSFAIPRRYPLVGDDLAQTERALSRAFQECDVVVTSGGVSVGEKDHVKETFARLGGKLDIWKIAMRPGKPFAFGRWKEKMLFALPGNPVSAMLTFFLLVRPALLRLQGAEKFQPVISQGTLAEPITNPGDRRHFTRVIIEPNGQVKSAGRQGSHMLNSTSRANGLLDVPPGASWSAGTPVTVILWS